MAAGINTASEAETRKIENLGLVPGHSYGLIAAAQVKNKVGEMVNLVKLRNPWGKFEWQGAWGDNSDEWTDDLRKELAVDPDADDGTFWMDFEDMKNVFGRIQICTYKDDYQYTHTDFVHQEPGSYSLFKLEVPTTGEYTLSVCQKGDRMFDRHVQYEYSNSRMILIKLNNSHNMEGGVTYIKGQKGFKERDSHMHIESLEAGTYFFYVEMEWVTQESYDEYKFTVTSYGCGALKFMSELHEAFTRSQVLEKAFMSKALIGGNEHIKESDMSEKGAPAIKLYNCTKSEEGYNFKLVINNETEAVYKEVVEYPTFKGLTLLEPYEGNSYTLEVKPGEKKFVIIKCDIGGYSMSMSYS